MLRPVTQVNHGPRKPLFGHLSLEHTLLNSPCEEPVHNFKQEPDNAEILNILTKLLAVVLPKSDHNNKLTNCSVVKSDQLQSLRTSLIKLDYIDY